MDKTSLYIQKLIVLLLIFSAGVILFPLIEIYLLIPILFFILSFLVSRITGQKPEFLFGLTKTDDFVNRKAGFWLLFKWILMLFGLIYDIAVYTLFGVYILFTLVLDLILLIKTILFWIIHAIIWFLKLFVPPLVFLYKMVIYYLFRWNWWIYKLSFNNIRKSINLNFYLISFRGSSMMLLVILLFYGVGILMGTPEIFVVGVVFSVLPLVWSFGEISSLRLQNAEHNSYTAVKNNFRSGFDAVKAILSYFIVFLLLAMGEVVFNLLGWIPQVGFSFMGLALNINTLASLILLFVFVIIIFGVLILPTHVVYTKDFNSDFNSSITFLGVIGRRFLRYVVSVVPAVFFGAVVTVIPALIVFLSVVMTLNVKNSLLDTRKGILSQRVSVLEGLEKYKFSKDIERVEFYKAYPGNVIAGFKGMKSLDRSIKNLKANILQGEKEIGTLSIEFYDGIDSLNKKIEGIKGQRLADDPSGRNLAQLDALKQSRMESFTGWKKDGELTLAKMKIDLADKRGMLIQLPIVFLLTIVWFAFFAGLVLAFTVSYLGNIYFELYSLREDGKPVYFRQVVMELKAANRNQPLLGFTLIVLLGVAWIYSSVILSAIETIGF